MEFDSYLSTHYSNSRRPLTHYPSLLAQHIVEIYNLRRGSSLLDFGAGRCEMAAGFDALGMDVTAADVSPEAARFASDLNLQFRLVDLSPQHQLPWDDNSFDVVFSKSLIEHLPAPLAFAQEALRVLKPTGAFIALTPDWESNYKIFYDDITHVRPFTTASMEQLLAMTGFRSIQVTRFRQLPMNWRFPPLNAVSRTIAPWVPVRATSKFLRWSRELMISGYGTKP